MQKYCLQVGKLYRKNLDLKKKFVKTDAIRYEKVRKAVLKYHNKAKIIIYCTTIRDVQDMYEYLVEECDCSKDEVASWHNTYNKVAPSMEVRPEPSGTALI